MTTYFSSDIDFNSLQDMVLRELKEPEAVGSEAVPLDLVKDKINEVYFDIFNDQRMKQSARENNVSFNVAADTTLNGNVSVGATSIILTDSTSYLPAGKILLQNEIVTYTGNNPVTNTLTGVTGVSVQHFSGEVVRQLYPLTTIAADIEEESIQLVNINGIPQQFMGYENLISAISYYPNCYTVYKELLLFSRQSTATSSGNPAQAFVVYTQKVTLLTNDTDKPFLIPNSFRVPLLVYGVCTKIAASDAFKQPWDWYKERSDESLSKYIAFKNNRVKDVQNKRRPTVYNSFSLFR